MAVTALPDIEHVDGARIEDDGPAFPLAFIAASVSTETGSDLAGDADELGADELATAELEVAEVGAVAAGAAAVGATDEAAAGLGVAGLEAAGLAALAR